jgi:hypothetical protein
VKTLKNGIKYLIALLFIGALFGIVSAENIPVSGHVDAVHSFTVTSTIPADFAIVKNDGANRFDDAVTITLIGEDTPVHVDISALNNGFMVRTGEITRKLFYPMQINDAAVSGTPAQLIDQRTPGYNAVTKYKFGQPGDVSDKYGSYTGTLVFVATFA